MPTLTIPPFQPELIQRILSYFTSKVSRKSLPQDTHQLPHIVRLNTFLHADEELDVSLMSLSHQGILSLATVNSLLLHDFIS